MQCLVQLNWMKMSLRRYCRLTWYRKIKVRQRKLIKCRHCRSNWKLRVYVLVSDQANSCLLIVFGGLMLCTFMIFYRFVFVFVLCNCISRLFVFSRVKHLVNYLCGNLCLCYEFVSINFNAMFEILNILWMKINQVPRYDLVFILLTDLKAYFVLNPIHFKYFIRCGLTWLWFVMKIYMCIKIVGTNNFFLDRFIIVYL